MRFSTPSLALRRAGRVGAIAVAINNKLSPLNLHREHIPGADLRERDCEAAFYLGEFALLNGKRDEAAPLLRDAGDKCPVGFTERYAARGELARSP